MVNKWEVTVRARLYGRMDPHPWRGQNRHFTNTQAQKRTGVSTFCPSAYESFVRRLATSSSHFAQAFVDKRVA
jgi:hypothetical protein